PGKDHDLAALEIDALREGRELAGLDVVLDRLDVLQRAVLQPDLAGQPRQAAVGGNLVLRDRQHETIDVTGHSRSPSVWWMSGYGSQPPAGMRGCSRIGRIGRTSTEPTVAGGMRAAIWIASLRSRASIM